MTKNEVRIYGRFTNKKAWQRNFKGDKKVSKHVEKHELVREVILKSTKRHFEYLNMDNITLN